MYLHINSIHVFYLSEHRAFTGAMYTIRNPVKSKGSIKFLFYSHFYFFTANKGARGDKPNSYQKICPSFDFVIKRVK